MVKRIIISTIVCLALNNAKAQQDPQFTQYMDNAIYVNPGYAGSRDVMNFTAVHRSQWVGMEGAPMTTFFNFNTPLSYKSLGAGLTFINDQIGPIQQSLIYGDFSYALRFKNTKGKLAFGLKAGLNVINSRTNELVTTVDNDPSFLASAQTLINPNFGFGMYYYAPNWYVGVSTPKILEGKYPGTERSIERRHYFIIAGYVMEINKSWKFRPSIQSKMTVGAPISIDVSATGIYNQKLYIGGMYRFGDSFGAILQYQILPQFKAGFAYDYAITQLTNYNIGTFEVLLSYDLIFKKDGIRSPRFF